MYPRGSTLAAFCQRLTRLGFKMYDVGGADSHQGQTPDLAKVKTQFVDS